MMGWLVLALVGGAVGLDGTSFPQVMVSRPLVAGALTGALLGRPLEGVLLGFLMEVYALVILPIGAVRYPESGTATVAATGAYVAATPVADTGLLGTAAGLDPGLVVLALVFALGWERVGGGTVVLLRRSNGRLLLGSGPVGATRLERLHLGAMTADFLRGAVVSLGGGIVGYVVLYALGPVWPLEAPATLALLGVFAAGMVGTAVPLFGGGRRRILALVGGVAVGVALGLLL